MCNQVTNSSTIGIFWKQAFCWQLAMLHSLKNSVDELHSFTNPDEISTFSKQAVLPVHNSQVDNGIVTNC